MATPLFESGAPDVLYVIDLSNYVLRAYHAVAPLSNAKGEPTHAAYGTTTMLERLVRERRPAFLAVAMDSGRDTFRKDLYPEYKATRPPAPEDLKVQLDRCDQIVRAFNIPILKQRGVEADDLIACAVSRARAHQIRVVIVGADKDMMQLVSDDVVMWDTMRDRVFGVPEVEERFGVKIAQLRDLLGLIGDTSDNIPGVPSVGPKTARDLLVQFGSLEGVYANIDSIARKKLKEVLLEHREKAFLSRELVTLKEDCPIEFDLDALRWGGRDVEALRRLYTELEFTRQLAALDMEGAAHGVTPLAAKGSALPASASVSVQKPIAAPAAAPTFSVITELTALRALLDRARQSSRLALSVEASSGLSRPVLFGLGLAVEPGQAHYVPLSHRYVGAPRQLALGDVASALRPVLVDRAVRKAGHDLKRSIIALSRSELTVDALGFDTMLASYLIDPEAKHALPEVAKRELGLELLSYDELTRKARGQKLAFDETEVEPASRFSAGAAEASLRLWDRLSERLSEAGLTRLFEQVELPLLPVLAKMEQLGVLVDTSKLAGLGASCESELARLEQEAHRIAKKPFNLSSPRQLETLLFDELGLKPLRRTKTSRSTDADTLEALAEEHELPRVILEHRQVSKLKGTYIDALPALVNPATGRIHTSWEQAVAATGRLSSTDPNLQNIPIRTELGRSIRSAFVAPEGYELVSADYSQIELRVLAHLSQDKVLLEAFRSGQDVHTRTAMEVFEVPESAVTAEMRRRSKAVNFGVIYGQGDSGLAKSLGISRAEANSFITTYFKRYEGVRRFMNQTLDAARSGEAVRSLLGRRRLLPDIRSGNRAQRFAAERIAMNMPIQGSAADVLKLAMLKLAEPVTPGARMVLTVHDELVFEVPRAEVAEASARIREAMEKVYEFDVPLLVELGHGENWNDAH
jgi:DNA polymerase-1